MQKKWTIYRERWQLSNWLLSLMTFNTVLVFCESSWVYCLKTLFSVDNDICLFRKYLLLMYLHEFLKWARKKCEKASSSSSRKGSWDFSASPNKLNWPNFSKTASILVIKVLMTLFTAIRGVSLHYYTYMYYPFSLEPFPFNSLSE